MLDSTVEALVSDAVEAEAEDSVFSDVEEDSEDELHLSLRRFLRRRFIQTMVVRINTRYTEPGKKR